MMRLRAPALVLGLLVALAGCDFGPSGPGSMQVTVTPVAPVGALVLDVRGVGIRGFDAVGDTRAWGATVDAASGHHRVVLVSETGDVLHFAIRVDDRGGELPTLSVVSGVDLQNRSLRVEGAGVSIER